MYKKQNKQISFEDFNQPLGLSLNPKNRWIKKSSTIPWDDLEKDYAKLFSSQTGNVAKPFRLAFGALLIQKEFAYSDEELVEQILENPYLQYFIGLPGYTEKPPFEASSLVHFRKRLDANTLVVINEKIIAANALEKKSETEDDKDDDSNSGTLILDATCAPQAIKFPTDTEILNSARKKAEQLIDSLCENNQLPKPRTYRKKARKVYLSVVRRKKKPAKFLRKHNTQLLHFLARDLRYLVTYQSQGYSLNEKEEALLRVLSKVAAQQGEMLKKQTHQVKERIVSVSQPYLRPIVRGKAKAAVEFGAKLDMSLSGGYYRVERLEFDAYNESEDLVGAVRRFHDREGHYPEAVLADKIYRNRGNLAYCKERGIRLSGPALGRPKKNQEVDKKQAYRDNADRVSVERGFSLLKRRYGLDLIKTKRSDTTLTSILLSLIAGNVSLWQILEALILRASERKLNFLIFNRE